MASKVEIANLALTELGAARITSFSDNTRVANTINAVYEEIVKEVISSYNWSSCIRRASLAQTTTTPNHEFSYSFQLPTNPKILKLIEADDGDNTNFPYVIEADKLLTDSSNVSIVYLAYLTNSEEYGIYLQSSIVKKLASAIAYNVTGNRALMLSKLQEYKMISEEMKAADSQQSNYIQIQSNDFTEDR